MSITEIPSEPKTKTTKEKKVELVGNSLKPRAAGHNSQINTALVEIFEEHEDLDSKIKELQAAKRQLRNKAKTEHDIQLKAFNHEISLRKLDRDVRIQFESNHHDLKIATGYQASLDLHADTIARTEQEYMDPSAVAGNLITRK